MTVRVLMVAEKPSIADTLAKALIRGQFDSRRGATPVLEGPGMFQGKPAELRITSVAGHVFSTDFPEKYNNWDKTDPQELFEADVIKMESNPKSHMPSHLKREASGCDYLVLWLDCDLEGENICFEVIRCVGDSLKGAGQKIFRAKFSSLVLSDLQKAYATSLGAPNKNEADAVEARQEIDLKTGVAFTRFLTRYFQGRYADLDSSLVSYGPCQTPTLWFCVQRHMEIQTFSPEPFYFLDLALAEPGSTKTFSPAWSRGRLFDQRVCGVLKDLVSDASSAVVVSVTEKSERRVRPLALNTVQMLKLASQCLGMGPQQAMHTAEKLYLGGYVTYPRTETNVYARSFDLHSVLERQSAATSNPWSVYAEEVLAKKPNPRSDGVDVGDHPPITPVRAVTRGELDGDLWRLYEMICRNFVASVSGDCHYKSQKAVFELRSADGKSCEEFYTTLKRVTDPGFMKALKGGFEKVEEDEADDGSGDRIDEASVYTDISLSKGMQFKVSKLAVGQGKTSPPSYLSESELLGLMEKNGIGTDASMATHINNICERNYVKLAATGSRRLVPSQLGVCLIQSFHAIDSELAAPKVRSQIEGMCGLVAKGKAPLAAVVKHSLEVFSSKFRFFVTNIEAANSLFETQFTPVSMGGRPLTRCGYCHKYMSFIEKRPMRLHCRSCGISFSLPSGASTCKPYREKQCPLDGFEVVLVSFPAAGGRNNAKEGKTMLICPMCFNEPPFEDHDDGDGSESSGSESDSNDGSEKVETPSAKGKSQQKVSTKGQAAPVSTSPKSRRRRLVMSCFECPNLGCPLSLPNNGVCACSNCESGVLCLDPEARKPSWRLMCNSCDFQLRMFNGASRVDLARSASGKVSQAESTSSSGQANSDLDSVKCETCNSNKLFVEYLSGGSSTTSGGSASGTTAAPSSSSSSPSVAPFDRKTGCIVCDPDLNKLVEGVVIARGRGRGGHGGGGGRGKGKGKRGGPRGKGPRGSRPPRR